MLTFRVAGEPIPQGSIAYKGHRGGRPVLVSDNDNLAGWRARVAAEVAWSLPAGWVALDEPVRLGLTFWMTPPKRPRFIVPATKPDLDKLIRAVLDGLAEAELYANDSRVFEFDRVRSRYATDRQEAGVVITVEWGPDLADLLEPPAPTGRASGD